MLSRLLVYLALFLVAASALADSKIPIDYVPGRVRRAIQDYVPGAELTKAEIANDDDYGPKYKCEYFRAGHHGSIQVSERGRLLDLDEDITVDQVPRYIRRIATRESHNGLLRKAHLDAEHGRVVYKVESYYGESSAKVKLKITRDGTILDRDYD